MKDALGRIAALAVTILGVVTLVFFFIHLLPGDPIDAMLGESAVPADREALRSELGLDQPLGTQYVRYVGNTLRGDLGASLVRQEPVASLIGRHLGTTALLAITAALIAAGLAIPLGALAAARPGSWIDGLATLVALGGVALPNFVIGPILIIIFSITLELTPVSGASARGSLALPALTLGLGMAAILTRLTRRALRDVLGEDYVRTARAKGASELRVFVRHALPTALLPIVTILGLQLGGLLGGAIVTETIFSWPGIGRLTLEAIHSRDYPLVQGCVLVIALAYVLVNAATDLLYSIIDPRIRFGSEAAR